MSAQTGADWEYARRFPKGNKKEETMPKEAPLEFLNRRIIGQTEAIGEIYDSVTIARAGLTDPSKPAGIFLLLGPTGVGKTHVVEKIAELCHGSSKKMLKVNCGEYTTDHEVAKILGSPPGYLGHRDTKTLFTKESLIQATSPNSQYPIILFDEIEKAAKSFTKVLLGLFDRGTLNLGSGEVVDFTKCLIFLTSNLGSAEIKKSLGFNMGLAPKNTTNSVNKISLNAAQKHFSPEFFNRLDRVITFRALDKKDIYEIITLEIFKLESRTGCLCTLSLTKAASNLLISEGFSHEYGARSIKRAIEKLITVPLSQLMLTVSPPKAVTISVKLNKIVLLPG